jgi:hypothetical protein
MRVAVPVTSIRGSASWQKPWLALAQVLLLAATFVLPLLYLRNKSVTTDEVTHLPAGYSYFLRKSIVYNPQHPPLIKEICALPLLFMDVKVPTDFPQDEWAFGQDFLFNQDAQRMLFWARIPVVLMSLGLAWVVMTWAGKLWGSGAGLLALFLYALDPTITAHAQFVTTDVGLAFFSTLYLFQLRSCLKDASWKRWGITGVLLGLALGTKFSALILIPITPVLMVLASLQTASTSDVRTSSGSAAMPSRPQHTTWKSEITVRLLGFALLLAIACLVLWMLYFLSTDPSIYWKGLRAVNEDHKNLHPYLLGTIKEDGWKSYFLIAWLVKTPIPVLILSGATISLFLGGLRKNSLEEAFLLLPAVSYFLVYSLFADNLGIRYLIPCFPLLFIFVSRIAAVAGRSKLLKTALVSLLLWHGAEYALIAPDHLSYFNQIAGGFENGVRWLDDSNVDWGQGLIQLRDYLEANGIRNYRLFYFGMGDPKYYGVTGDRIWDSRFFLDPSPGIYVLSAHRVARGHAVLRLAYGEGPKNWLLHRRPSAIVGHAYYLYGF